MTETQDSKRLYGATLDWQNDGINRWHYEIMKNTDLYMSYSIFVAYDRRIVFGTKYHMKNSSDNFVEAFAQCEAMIRQDLVDLGRYVSLIKSEQDRARLPDL